MPKSRQSAPEFRPAFCILTFMPTIHRTLTEAPLESRRIDTGERNIYIGSCSFGARGARFVALSAKLTDSIFLLAAQVKKRKTAAHRGRELRKRKAFRIGGGRKQMDGQRRSRTWDIVANCSSRKPDLSPGLYASQIFFPGFIANCRDFTILITGLSISRIVAIFPYVFHSEQQPEQPPQIFERFEGNSIGPGRRRIGEAAYGDERGVFCTTLFRDDDSGD